MTPVTVVFRVDRENKEPIAIFISKGSTDPKNGMHTAYAHKGQHTTASRQWIKEKTRPAAITEYKSLLEELRSIGYDVTIKTKFARPL